MASIELGQNGSARLVISDPRRGPDGELWSVVATLRTDGLEAQRTVNAHYATCMDELVNYFDDLADHWQGWDGVKEYKSLEGKLALSARHDGYGHVRLMVAMERFDGSANDWSCSGLVITDPGSQMAEAAASARELLVRFSLDAS
jgi:hypothetical protein